MHRPSPLKQQIRSVRALSLVELIMAMTLFIVISTGGVIMIHEVSKASRKVEMEEYLYTETQNLLERIARQVQRSGIDYEEYYSQNVLGATVYGDNYGDYHMAFFHPGTGGPETGGYGAYCIDGVTTYTPGACTPNTSTFDYETGKHPYSGMSGYTTEDANAVCDYTTASDCSSNLSYHESSQLYLINKTGNVRTFFVVEKNTIYRVAMVELEGIDNDGDGIYEAWECTSDYNCTGLDASGTYSLPEVSDLSNGSDDKNFTEISPRSIFIDEIVYFVSPIEDPFKGYDETETGTGVFQSVQLQPKVTIRITAHYQLYDDSGNPIDFEDAGGFIGQSPTITLQTTVSTGNLDAIPAYEFP